VCGAPTSNHQPSSAAADIPPQTATHPIAKLAPWSPENEPRKSAVHRAMSPTTHASISHMKKMTNMEEPTSQQAPLWEVTAV